MASHDDDRRLAALRAHLAEGAAQANRGEFVAYALDELLAELDREAEPPTPIQPE